MRKAVPGTRYTVLSFILLLVGATLAAAQQAATRHNTAAPSEIPVNVVTLPSASPLYEVQIMVRAGSAEDPSGKEGTASLVGRMLIEGGFGDPKNPVTKEKLAEITRPWGEAAYPQVRVDKETTVFSMTVPRDVFPQFMARVLKPMLTEPLFLETELERVRKEALVGIRSNLRFEQQEQLGLLALDDWVLEGTPMDHLAQGTVQGLQAVTRPDLQGYYARYYHMLNLFVAASITDPASLKLLFSALPRDLPGFVQFPSEKAKAATGCKLLIITQPNAIATGVHLGFPIPVKRGDPDYWPLFVANVFFGAHRDNIGRLYKDIREERGYNYGDYSYIEYYAARPQALFPPPGTPRDQQYFSMWIRPVGHQYAHFILKTMTWELDNFIKNGMTAEQVEAAKQKTRTLYLSYADSKGRQLGYRLDDMFYGMKDHGYLEEMLANIDKLTAEQVNAAIKKYLQVANLKYIIVTNESMAQKLADDIAGDTNVVSKTREEYHISEPVPPEKQKMLAQDEQWKAYKLNIPRENIAIVKAEQMFETNANAGMK
ncbi:MAG: pitrilysin family protein [Terriglobales bacterium]